MNEVFLSLVLLISSNPKTVRLTLDDGPHPIYTKEVLSILQENQIKANFFLVGDRVKENPELVREIVREGHQIGAHSLSHRELTKIPREEATKEILDSMQLIQKFQKSDRFRFPYGSHNKYLDKVVSGHGYRAFGWDIDSEDWKYKDSDRVCSNVIVRIQKTKDGAIILLHDTHKQTVEALKIIVKYLKEHNIETKTLE